MAKIRRISLLALIACLVVALAAPATAQSTSTSRRKRDQARAKRAELAKKINALKASDEDLERAVRHLDDQVRAQQARAAAARQAVQAAEAQRQAAEARLQQTQADMAKTRSGLVARAIQAYVQPQKVAASEQLVLTGMTDLADLSRRAALLNQIAGRDREALDRMHGLKVDLAQEQEYARRARVLAEQRRKLEERSLAQLREATAAKRKLQAALDVRIKEFQEEADGMAKEEAALTSLIRSREQVTRVSRGVEDVVSGRISGSGLMWPVGGPVTSGYGMRWGRMHQGIDISAGTGTPIRAAKAGTVIMSGWFGGYGNAVIIDHGGSFSTLYGHMSRIAAGDGAQLSRGQVIGYVGSTGHSTGPHLHFEVRVGGSAVNPRSYLP